MLGATPKMVRIREFRRGRTSQIQSYRNVKSPSYPSFDARVDVLVARWLERCATNVEAAQRLFQTDRRPTREVGLGVVSSPRWDESPERGRRRGRNSITVVRETAV